MSLLYTVLLLLLFLGSGNASKMDDEESLPVYLKGMNWSKVQEYLKDDLSLTADVVPHNYEIDLTVNVRGHAGAEKSEFNGTVTIIISVIRSVDKIELHSRELTTEKAELISTGNSTPPIGVTQIKHDPDRETISIHANRTMDSGEQMLLKITYRGMARMDEYGLYENWDPKFNKSADSNGQFVLASRNYPTGARHWFPCFDEPQFKAHFVMRINHPSGLSAYANTDLEKTEAISEGRTLSIFVKTHRLSTYQVALSLNHLSVEDLDVKRFYKVRLIKSNNSHDYHSSLSRNEMSEANDIPSLIKQQLEHLNAHKFIPNIYVKLDIIILEGTRTVSVQPGLVTIGRAKLWNLGRPTSQIGELEQLRIGNRIALQSTNELWLNEMFSRVEMNETACENLLDCVPYDIWEASLHERPLRDKLSTSTKQFLTSRNALPILKATQLLKLVLRFCPDSDVQDYLLDTDYRRFNLIELFIDKISYLCQDSAIARQFLEDFIDQPGKAFLTVQRAVDEVIIKQTRYHSTYFDEALRDNRTRYTIPVFYTIDGIAGVRVFRKNDTSLTIKVPQSSLFLIDPSYDHLYLAYYEDIIVPDRNITEEERRSVAIALPKTMIAALNIGFVKWSVIHDQLRNYTERGIFGKKDHIGVFFTAKQLIMPRMKREYKEDASRMVIVNECHEWTGEKPSWDGMFNNETLYWQHPTNTEDSAIYTHCIPEWSNFTQYRGFLESNFLGENTVIRPGVYPHLIQRVAKLYKWRDLHRFFFREAVDAANHRVTLLADLVLNHGRIEDADEYPDSTLSEDYLAELRAFVLRNPRRAASMSTELEKRMEREFVREELRKWHNEDEIRMEREYFAFKRKGNVV